MSAATSPTTDGPDDSSASSSHDSAWTMTSTATSVSILRAPYPSSQITPSSYRAPRDSHRTSGYFNGPEKDIDPGDFLQKHLGSRESMLANYDNSSKRRSQYYEDQFQYKDGAVGSVRERAQTESPVIAELRTNVIVKDEFTLVTELSFHLAARYARPNSAIMVQVNHSACLSFGGTFDPCYILTLQAVPASMGPATNKRNAALIQAFMADTMNVSPERGIIKFQPIAEENLAQGGTTIMGDIERQEKQHAIEHGHSVKKAITAAGRKSLPSLRKSAQRLSMDGKEVILSKDVHTANSRESMLRPTSMISNDLSRKRHSVGEVVPLSATILSPSDIYELPCVEVKRPAQPVPSHHRSSSVSNGLRMNPVSPLDCTPRPLTIGASPFLSSTAEKRRSASEPFLNSNGAALPPPSIKKATTQHTSRPHSFLKIDPTANNSISSTETRPKTSDGSTPRGPTAFYTAPPAPRTKSTDRASTRAAERERLSDKFIRPRTAHELRPFGGKSSARSSLKGSGDRTTTMKAFGTSISSPISNTTFLPPPTLVTGAPGQDRFTFVKSHTSVRVPPAAAGAIRNSQKSSLLSSSTGSPVRNRGPGGKDWQHGDASTANTAKRRSTTTSSSVSKTATLAIPEDEAVVGGYGSGYGLDGKGSVKEETKSLKGSLGGKRRSLMAALRGKVKVKSEGF